MLALYRTGQQAEALRVYDAGRTTLRSELGVDPAPELRSLHERILRQDPALLGERPPEHGHRAAQELAHRVEPAFDGGAVFVPLADTENADDVLSEIQGALGLASNVGERQLDDLVRALTGRRWLLLLDNFEQVADAGPQVLSLVQAVPGLTVLVTSRAPLNLSQEYVYRIPELPLPRPDDDPATILQSDAVKLFVTRARAASGLEAGTDEAHTLAHLCAELDGIPLALELAAQRTRVYSLQTMVPRLRHSLTSLGAGPRDLPARQRTLRGVFDWSYGLLTEPEARVARQLSVFAGSWTAEAATAVCVPAPDDLQEVLTSLADKSFVLVERDRMRMLRVVREYLCEKLAGSADEASVRARYLAWVETAVRQMSRDVERAERHPSSRVVLQSVGFAAEVPNISAALDWCVAQPDVQRLSVLLSASARMFHASGLGCRLERWVCSAEDLMPAVPEPYLGGLVQTLGGYSLTQRMNPRQAERYARAALRDHSLHNRYSSYFNLGVALRCQGRFPEAIHAFEASLAELGQVEEVTPALPRDVQIELAETYEEHGDRVRARKVLYAVMPGLALDDDEEELAYTQALTALLDVEDAPDRAWASVCALTAQTESWPSSGLVENLRLVLGTASLALGHEHAAAALAGTVVTGVRSSGALLFLPDACTLVGLTTLRAGDVTAGLRLLAAADAVRERTGLVVLYRRLGALSADRTAEARRALGHRDYLSARTEGRRLGARGPAALLRMCGS